jgi:Ca2+-binding EF-hand superfamily protein
LYKIFDKNGDGSIQFEEFMHALLGPMSDARKSLVQFAFNKLDSNANGTLELTEVKMKFNPARHP